MFKVKKKCSHIQVQCEISIPKTLTVGNECSEIQKYANTNTVPAKEANPRFRQLEISVQRHKSLRPFEATNGH